MDSRDIDKSKRKKRILSSLEDKKTTEILSDSRRIQQRHRDNFFLTAPIDTLAQQGSTQWQIRRDQRRTNTRNVKEPALEPIPGFSENQNSRNPDLFRKKTIPATTTKYASYDMKKSASSSILESALMSGEFQDQKTKPPVGKERKYDSSANALDSFVLPEVTNFLLLDPKLFENITEPLAIIQLVRKYPEIGFLYMIHPVSRASVNFSPYKLKIVGYEKINKTDFFTVSLHGVTHYWAKETSFTDLVRWENEYKLYLQLLRKRTFSKFRMWKAFRVWYKTVRYFIIKERNEVLEKTLYILHPNLRSALLTLTKMFVQMDLKQLVKIEEGTTSTVGNFFGLQVKYMNELKEKLNKFRGTVKRIMLEACRGTLLKVGFVPDDCILDYPEMASNADKMTYAEQANKRNYCLRLTRFIRLVDYLILTFKFVIVRDSSAYLLSILKIQLERFYRKSNAETDQSEGKRSELVAVAKKSEMMAKKSELGVKKSELGTKKSELGTKKSEMIAPRKMDDPPALFTINLLLLVDTLIYDPDANTFIETVLSVVTMRQDVMKAIANLTPDAQFESFTRPVINWKMEEKVCGLGPNISAVFEGDKMFNAITSNLRKRLTEAFQLAVEYSRTLEIIKDFYLENESLDLESLNSPKHGVEFFEQSLAKYTREQIIVDALPSSKYLGLLLVDLNDFKKLMVPSPNRCLQAVYLILPVLTRKKMNDLFDEVQSAQIKMEKKPGNTEEYVEHIMFVDHFAQRIEEVEAISDTLVKMYELIEAYKVPTPAEDFAVLSTLAPVIMMVRMVLDKRVAERASYVDKFCSCVDKDIEDMDIDLMTVKVECENPMLLDPNSDPDVVREVLHQLQTRLAEFIKTAEKYKQYQKHFHVQVAEFPTLDLVTTQLRLRLLLWNSLEQWDAQMQIWRETDFNQLDPEQMTNFTQQFIKVTGQLERGLPENAITEMLKDKVMDMRTQLPVIADLRNPNLKTRHWERIEAALGVSFADTPLTLDLLKELKADKLKDVISNISSAAASEAALETQMKRVEEAWRGVEFTLLPYRESRDIFVLGSTEEIQLLLDDSIMTVMTILSSRNCGPIKMRVEEWEGKLRLFNKTLDEWWEVQRNWMYLESIFTAPDIQRQLPAEAKIFMHVDKVWKEIMRRVNKTPMAIHAATQPGLLEALQNCSALLNQIMKCLEAYLEGKCVIFPRFFFLSNDELLEILSQTRNPLAIQPHLRKCFDGVVLLEFAYEEEAGVLVPTGEILAMLSGEGEKVPFVKGLKARGSVEDWLGRMEEAMYASIRRSMKSALLDYPTKRRPDWVISSHPSQCVLTVCQIIWSAEVERTLSRAEEDALDLMPILESKAYSDLNDLAGFVRGDLTSLNRIIIGALITLDVHARDILTTLVELKVSSREDFKWQCQLRYYWEMENEKCNCCMSNNSYFYGYEYLGASPRLVVTPLTDRHYLCCMGAMQLNLGAAPAGPAGTGKTETTKDLAKSLATQCVVFNCSDGIDFLMMRRFFSGIVQSGAWACFDEFNRIELDVLSVIAQQLITIRYAKMNKLSRFVFDGKEMKLVAKCAVFITMNPGYAGRTELPDNLKALFRPISMMVPNYALIAEVVLYSEGFESSRVLARKMTRMYMLCSEQLSQQDHYDFGMRAVKSVLVMAGALKRENPDKKEDVVLLRALQDSNLPKFLAMDANLFGAILQDLFPETSIPEQDYGYLSSSILKTIKRKNLQTHPAFVNKVIQLYDTMLVRHGCMLLGPPAAGKTTTYEVLRDAISYLHSQGIKHPQYKPVHVDVLNPKSVSIGELYGEVNKATLEWKDGLIGYYTRIAANATDKDHRWIICDGPVDAVWIENMNSALDDNKLLCLANSERIKLTNWIHYLFEVQDLAQASPATVSRCGMVYVDPNEMRWNSYVKTWLNRIQNLSNEHLSNYISELFDRYLDKCLTFVDKFCVQAMPQVELSRVSTICYMMESILFVTEKLDISLEFNKICTVLCQAFVYSILWALGGNLLEDSMESFGLFLKEEFEDESDAKIPAEIDLWNLYLDFERKRLTTWDRIIPIFSYNPSTPFFDMLVPTVDTVRFGYALEKLLAVNKPVLYTGFTGVGKSVIARDLLLGIMDVFGYIPVFLNFSAQTSSSRTQEMIESKLVKKRKTIFGAPPGKRIIFFVDDVNMPKLDTYGSQPPIELLRQILDFKGLYERDKLFWKEFKDITLCAACAPPGGGRNPIPARFVRHFSVFYIPPPTNLRQKNIFTSILGGFLQPFTQVVREKCEAVVNSAVEVFHRMSTELLPTPSKSHYIFNLRDLSKCFQGFLQVSSVVIRHDTQMFRLFCHETQRVFHDRLISMEDKMFFHAMIADIAERNFDLPNIDPEMFVKDPIIFGDFMKMGVDRADRIYDQITNFELMKNVLEEYLLDYNMGNPKEMKLVLFMDAMMHVARIIRILRQERGNAMLVGVGGAGKQTVTKLSSFISNCLCFQIELKRGYDYNSFHDDLKKLYHMTGVKDSPTVFLFTDSQIVIEEFVEDINNILNSGEVPGMYPQDEIELILMTLRPLAKDAGINETDREAVFAYFINRVRTNLHIVLCMSPIGDAFRIRCRMFPSLVNCCTIDWFFEWPDDALLGVAKLYFEKLDLGEKRAELLATLPTLCVQVHQSVTAAAERFYKELRRHYYTTPTSYLELINFFTILLSKKKNELTAGLTKMERGLTKLGETNRVVGEMEIKLRAIAPVLKQKADVTELIMLKLVEDQEAADQVRQIVQEDEAMAKVKAEETQAFADDAEQDLAEALPALEKAIKALDSLDKSDIAEVRVFTSPPELVQTVMEAVCILLHSKTDWATAKQLLGDPNFLRRLYEYDKDHIKDSVLKQLKKYIVNPDFVPDVVEKTSKACKSICMWVRAIDVYARVFKTVVPKRKRLDTARKELEVVTTVLKEQQAKLATVEGQIDELKVQYMASLEERESLSISMDQVSTRLKRASRLTTGLANEQIRWTANVKKYRDAISHIVGNVFVSTACIAYMGAFTTSYREDLIAFWVKRANETSLPISSDYTLTSVMADPFDIRQWFADGLPKNNLSIENAILVKNARRWPLMIDPQDQANRWIRNMEARHQLRLLKMSEGNFLKVLEMCICVGTPVLLEDVGETLEPVLEPLLLKQTTKVGARLIMKLGDAEVEYDPKFRFYITTKLVNPHYLPEVSTKVTIINFTVTIKGLEDQLLSDVVQLERPDLEILRQQLIIRINNDKNQLLSIEDTILRLLFLTEGNILDNEELLTTLNEAKTTAAEVEGRLLDAEATETMITEAREKYRIVAERGAILYFAVSKLPEVDPMYQSSLKYFNQLFNQCIQSSERSDVLEERLQTLLRETTFAVYTTVARGLFEHHKLVYSTLICSDIMLYANQLPQDEWNLFLRGVPSTDAKLPPKPNIPWLTEATWTSACLLEPLANNFVGLSQELIAAPLSITVGSFKLYLNPRKWDGYHPREGVKVAWVHKLTDLQKLILVKVLHEDKLVQAVTEFVSNRLGRQFVERPKADLPTLYGDMTKTTPLVFILTLGSDPMEEFLRFAKEREVIDNLHAVSLGQGQGPIAEKLLATAFRTGDWVFLQNCHVLASWMPKLENIVKTMIEEPKELHQDFRLFMSSLPSNVFPVSVLQNSVKVTIEAPKGLRANIKRTFANLKKSFFEDHLLQLDWRKMVFGLCFFHAVIQERKKFGPLGWNIKYEFNDGDLECALATLELFCKDSTIRWDALVYTTYSITYGGRVTDNWDARTLETVLKIFLNPPVLDKSYKFSPSGTYYAPDVDTLEQYQNYIDGLPIIDDPEIFGMHDNANISFQMQESQALVKTLLSAQSRAMAVVGGKSADEIVDEIADSILDKIIDKIDMDKANPMLLKRDKAGRQKSTTVVLLQEIDRFNRLLANVREEVNNLKKAIKGLIVMNENLETIFNSLLNNQVPQYFAKFAYPSLKSFGSWLRDLVLRVAFMDDWVVKGQLNSIWLPVFFFPQGFLTSILQTHARKYGLPIDELSFSFNILPTTLNQADLGPSADQKPRDAANKILNSISVPEDGTNIHGLFLDACRFDVKRMKLVDPFSGEMNPPLPIVQFIPKLTVENIIDPKDYLAPLYKTSARFGVLSTTGHSTNFVMTIQLPSRQTPSYWIIKGAALLCQNTD